MNKIQLPRIISWSHSLPMYIQKKPNKDQRESLILSPHSNEPQAHQLWEACSTCTEQQSRSTARWRKTWAPGSFDLNAGSPEKDSASWLKSLWELTLGQKPAWSWWKVKRHRGAETLQQWWEGEAGWSDSDTGCTAERGREGEGGGEGEGEGERLPVYMHT